MQIVTLSRQIVTLTRYISQTTSYCWSKLVKLLDGFVLFLL